MQFAEIAAQFVKFDISEIHDQRHALGLQRLAEGNRLVTLNQGHIRFHPVDGKARRLPGKPGPDHRIAGIAVDDRRLPQELHLGARLEPEDAIPEQSGKHGGLVAMLDKLFGQMMRAGLNAATELGWVAVAACKKNFHGIGLLLVFFAQRRQAKPAASLRHQASFGGSRFAKGLVQDCQPVNRIGSLGELRQA